MNYRWLLRAKRWAQNPPSEGRVKFIAAIILLCAALFAIDRLVGWPQWLTPNQVPRGRF
ncbi:hypothetical protein C8N32_10527 [Rhodovulum imhoffii]|uniref:Uncharacterized protein n=1 Tax=Rhodovulum imhoffii TaxID=365340 RepID=A0A2T5BT94_9RHOB|nr:hypothetical protein [Rhodovulum imhoffii]PTN02657.1 hypothetical protein C8N32_10527 [Rhodovulum imhoffii]